MSVLTGSLSAEEAKRWVDEIGHLDAEFHFENGRWSSVAELTAWIINQLSDPGMWLDGVIPEGVEIPTFEELLPYCEQAVANRRRQAAERGDFDYC